MIGQKPVEIYGIFGVMDLPSGPYLILISQASAIGEILSCQLFKVENLLFVPLANPYAPYKI